MSEKILSKVKPGVVYGKDLQEIFRIAKANQFALPAVNVVGTDSINAVMEAAKAVNSPVMIQFSNGGGVFCAGKSLSNDGQQAAIQGCISGAMHIHRMAEMYGIPVVCTPTMPPRSSSPGLTVSWMRVRNSTLPMASPFSAPTCSTFLKSL